MKHVVVVLKLVVVVLSMFVIMTSMGYGSWTLSERVVLYMGIFGYPIGALIVIGVFLLSLALVLKVTAIIYRVQTRSITYWGKRILKK